MLRKLPAARSQGPLCRRGRQRGSRRGM